MAVQGGRLRAVRHHDRIHSSNGRGGCPYLMVFVFERLAVKSPRR